MMKVYCPLGQMFANDNYKVMMVTKVDDEILLVVIVAR